MKKNIESRNVLSEIVFIFAFIFGVIGVLFFINYTPSDYTPSILFNLTMIVIGNGLILFGILLALLGIYFTLSKEK